jgi:hypothetical protein
MKKKVISNSKSNLKIKIDHLKIKPIYQVYIYKNHNFLYIAINYLIYGLNCSMQGYFYEILFSITTTNIKYFLQL